jgi:hypothetical protein
MVASRKATLAFGEHLPEREILRPRTQDRRSVKDVHAHLLGCDEETMCHLKLTTWPGRPHPVVREP